jgi:hypothetical protein
MTVEAGVLETLSDTYRAFARIEAHGVSVIYEDLARFIAESPEILAFVASLPPERQQPNLFLAAVRDVAGVPRGGDDLVRIVRESREAIRHVMLTRTTQTNEPARCSVLLPVLSRLPQPLALVEVGASAGLCLLPDRYGYNYGDVSLRPTTKTGSQPPVFTCRASHNTPLPTSLPTIAWRAGLDLNPLDVGSHSDMAWLKNLVWPEQVDRLSRLRLAIRVAREDPPPVRSGDLFVDLQPLFNEVPDDATLVVFHTAVLAYVSNQKLRDHFAASMIASSAVWISNEAPGVFPSLAAGTPEPTEVGRFLLAVNGKPMAWTAPHGQAIEWIAERDSSV